MDPSHREIIAAFKVGDRPNTGQRAGRYGHRVRAGSTGNRAADCGTNRRVETTRPSRRVGHAHARGHGSGRRPLPRWSRDAERERRQCKITSACQSGATRRTVQPARLLCTARVEHSPTFLHKLPGRNQLAAGETYYLESLARRAECQHLSGHQIACAPEDMSACLAPGFHTGTGHTLYVAFLNRPA
jgi:hypothetical protein